LFLAYIAGRDTFAKGLKVAYKLLLKCYFAAMYGKYGNIEDEVRFMGRVFMILRLKKRYEKK
jgi:hypothetical protein